MEKDPATKEVLNTAFRKECVKLAQGDNKIETKGKNSLFVLGHNKIKQIPSDRTVRYANIVVYYHPQNIDPNRVRITAGGNLINYPGKIMTRTEDLTTANILWKSIISTINAKLFCDEIKDFYL